MPSFTTTRERAAGDSILGALVAVIGLVVLGNAVVATRVSIQFLGYMLLLAGFLALAAAVIGVLRTGRSGPTATGGAASLVIGLVCLRNVEAAAVTLTLMIGALYLVIGVARLMAAAGAEDRHWPHLVAGGASTVMGLAVIFNVVEASYLLLGVLLGVQLLVEGLTLILVGRISVDLAPAQHAATASSGPL